MKLNAIIKSIFTITILMLISCGDLPRDNKFDPLASNSPGYPDVDFSVNGGSAACIDQQPSVFIAEGSNIPDDAEVQYRWFFQNDGVWTAWSPVKTLNRTYVVTGVEEVTIEAKNSIGMIKSIKKVVQIVNSQPPLANFTISPLSPGRGQTVTFDSSSSSDDDTNSTDLQVRWDFESDGTYDGDWSTTKTTTHVYFLAGTYTVTLQVKDKFGTGNIKTSNITVAQSQSPVANFTVSPLSPYSNSNTTFDGSSSTDDDSAASEIQLRWDYDNDGTFDTDWSFTKTSTHIYTVAGSYTVRLEVKDKFGLVGDEVKTVTVLNALFFDDFESGNLDKWLIGFGSWNIINGTLTCNSQGIINIKTFNYSKYTVKYNLKINSSNRGGGVGLHSGIITSWAPGVNNVLYHFWSDNNTFGMYYPVAFGSRVPNFNFTFELNKWYPMKVEVDGSNLKCYCNEIQVFNINNSLLTEGGISIWMYNSNNFAVDDVLVY